MKRMIDKVLEMKEIVLFVWNEVKSYIVNILVKNMVSL